MKKTSGIAKTLRTSIADLQDLGCDLSDEQLGRVAGGLLIGVGVCKKGTTTTVANKCWQASASATAPGTPDNAQDLVND